MGNYFSLIQTKEQKNNTDTHNLVKLIWYDIDTREKENVDTVYVEIIEPQEKLNLDLDVYTELVYNNLNILIKSQGNVNLKTYKIISDYIVKYNVKFNELLEKQCMCYFLYWELKPFLSESKDLQYIFTKFQNRFGWDFTDKRY